MIDNRLFHAVNENMPKITVKIFPFPLVPFSFNLCVKWSNLLRLSSQFADLCGNSPVYLFI